MPQKAKKNELLDYYFYYYSHQSNVESLGNVAFLQVQYLLLCFVKIILRHFHSPLSKCNKPCLSAHCLYVCSREIIFSLN